MPTRFVAALVLLAVSVAPARAQTVERFAIKGAQNVIVIPENWNGSLFLYAHGYTADKKVLAPIPEDLAEADQLLLPGLFFTPAGYAAGVTSFRSVGWYVKDAIKDVENLRRYFVKKYGKPKHTYVWGHSGGGMVTEAMIEFFPHTYEGASPMCGPGAGAWRNFNGAYDLRVLYEYLCKDVPGAQFLCGVCSDGRTRCLVDGDCPTSQTCATKEEQPPLEDGLTAECTTFLLDHPERFSESSTAPGGDFVRSAVATCFGDGTPSVEQAARRDFYVRASQIPESFIGTDLFFASVGIAEVVHRRTGGKHPWGNIGVDYASPMLTAEERTAFNTGAHRSAADASAVRYMRRFFEPRGKTSTKVITVHALDDGLVIPENEEKYRQAFEAAGRSDQLVQLYAPTGGHCLFLSAWAPSLQALTAWVEHGQKPTLASVAALPPCNNTCLTNVTPGAWGLKVVEREQKGAPLRTLACIGQPGDCPAGATCSGRKLRCE